MARRIARAVIESTPCESLEVRSVADPKGVISGIKLSSSVNRRLGRKGFI